MKNETLKTYNAKIVEYASEIHVTHYMNSIVRGRKKDMKSNFRKTYVNDDRTDKEIEHCLSQSLKRTKNNIYYIARSNDWEYFITLTFDRNIIDSSNYDTVVRTLMTFLNNLKSRKCKNLVYLIVPEFHSDNEHYHFHGLLSNTKGMNFIDSGHVTLEGDVIYNIADWSYGFTTATAIKDTNKVSGYITKYITKQTCAILKNKKRYYASRNANRAKEIFTVIDKEVFIEENATEIKNIKTVDVPCAHQRCTYIEVSNGKISEGIGTLQNRGIT